MWFERIKKFYQQGLWSEDRVRTALDLNMLTEEEFQEIMQSKEEVTE